MFITAQQIHNGKDWLQTGTTLEIDERGTILTILSAPVEGTVYYQGMLAPGFVNVHCHLELSHMKGVIPQHTGLVPFLKNVMQHRNNHSEEEKSNAKNKAYNELITNGIVAVGDISNTIDTLDLRKEGKLHFHTFIEALGFSEVNAARSFSYAETTYKAYAGQIPEGKTIWQTITPHAPYSVSEALFRLIDTYQPDSLLSIHNQESIDELQYYRTKQGAINDLLASLNIDASFFTPTGKSSLQSYLQYLNTDRPYIFVHNTCTERADIQFAQSRLKEAYWCLCPNANLYIENCLPEIDMLISECATICIGTDSLASNSQLCILSELCTIKENYPDITWGTLFTWATYNGAKALQMDDVIGSIEIGKCPGIIQITGLDRGIKPTVKRVI